MSPLLTPHWPEKVLTLHCLKQVTWPSLTSMEEPLPHSEALAIGRRGNPLAEKAALLVSFGCRKKSPHT